MYYNEIMIEKKTILKTAINRPIVIKEIITYCLRFMLNSHLCSWKCTQLRDKATNIKPIKFPKREITSLYLLYL